MITCIFIWIVSVLAITAVICSISNSHLTIRFEIGLGIVVILFGLWIASEISVGGSVLPDGYPYPWTVINSGLHHLYPTRGAL